MNTKSADVRQVQALATERTVGFISGTAQVEVVTSVMPIKAGMDHPAKVYAAYVEEQVTKLMDQYGRVPTKITASLKFNDE